jgi:alpha-mannosidase
MCWLPDVFGYPSSLPEILAGCGVRCFYTYKLHWQAKNPFPAHLFRWRGLDGTEILAHVVNHAGGYNNNVVPEHLYKGWSLYAQKAEYPEVLFPFGWGDGGGGPTEEMLEMLQRAKGRFPGLPAVRTGTAQRYFDQVARAAPDLPVWDGELYVETHRGTYTTQSAMKRANRVSERMLRDAEILASLARLAGRRVDTRPLRGAWESVLVHQFHDILPGSSIGMVYAEALAAHAGVQRAAERVAEKSVAALMPAGARRKPQGIAVFNTLSWARRDIVAARVADRKGPISVVAPDGRKCPAQVISRAGGRASIVFQAEDVPPLGYAIFAISKESPDGRRNPLAVSTGKLENRFFRMTLDKEGAITRLYDKINRRDVIAAGRRGNDLQLMQDGPEREDAWNVHETSDRRHYPFEGPHRSSAIEQDIVLYADLPRIDFVTRADWQERQTMLKAAFPLAIRATRATYEVQFGAYERPTHRNTSWDQQKFEVPAQRWADLSESGYGVSLLNDCRYGYDAKDNVLRLTLLRGTIFPDPEADRGRHEFAYALLPHAGGWAEGETVRRAWELNVPARAMAAGVPGDSPPARGFLSVEGAPAVVEALKPAEDGHGHVLRVYEPNGGRGTVRIRLGFPAVRVRECNLVEEDGERVTVRKGAFQFEIRPFQIRTFRLEGES